MHDSFKVSKDASHFCLELLVIHQVAEGGVYEDFFDCVVKLPLILFVRLHLATQLVEQVGLVVVRDLLVVLA